MKKIFWTLILGFIFVGVVPTASYADCTNPAGVAGEQIYNNDHNVMQFCDGTNWTAMRGTLSTLSCADGEVAVWNGTSTQWECGAGGGGSGSGGGGGASCALPWGGTIGDGNSVTAYQDSAPVGTNCVSEIRSCDDGTLDGTYTNQTCNDGCLGANKPASNCSGTITNAAHGETRTTSPTDTSCCGCSFGDCGSCSGFTGNHTYQCNNGLWNLTGGTCSSCSKSCTGGCASCFTAGTMVTMADGSKKSIEKLEKGDVVLGQDDAHNEVLEMETPDIGARKLYAFNGGDFFVTEEHPFWLKSGQWAAINPEATLKERKDFSELYGDIKKLEIGDILQLENNNFMTLEKIESRDRHNPKMPVYNPRLSGNKTYYANGFLVHNK